MTVGVSAEEGTARPVRALSRWRARTIAIGLVVVVAVVLVFSARYEATQAEFLGLLALSCVVWVPVLCIRTRAYPVVAVVYAVLLAVVGYVFGATFTLLLSLPTLLAALFPRPPAGVSVAKPLLAGLGASVAVIVAGSLLVVPTEGETVVICTGGEVTEESLVAIGVQIPTGKGYDLPPGVTAFTGYPDIELHYAPFAPEHDIQSVIDRARADSRVTAVGRGSTFQCPR